VEGGREKGREGGARTGVIIRSGDRRRREGWHGDSEGGGGGVRGKGREGREEGRTPPAVGSLADQPYEHRAQVLEQG